MPFHGPFLPRSQTLTPALQGGGVLLPLLRRGPREMRGTPHARKPGCAEATMTTATKTFTAEDKLQAVRREIEQRVRVYPRLVMIGSMTQKFADHQLGVMRAIADDYEKLVETERLL